MAKISIKLVITIIIGMLINISFSRNLQNSDQGNVSSGGGNTGIVGSGTTSSPGSDATVSYTKCLPREDREKQDIKCTKENAPVCGSIKDRCVSSDCKKTYENACFACAQLDVLYHESGVCVYDSVDPIEPEIVEVKCHDKDREVQACTEQWSPVCGVTEKCMYDLTTCTTYSSGCFACSNKEVNYHRSGECKKDPDIVVDPAPIDQFFIRQQCQDAARPSTCLTDEYYPVCAFVKDCDFSKSNCMITKNNKCEACNDKNVLEYTEGKCPEPIKCDPSNRPEICTMEYKGVCQVKSNCKKDEECYTNTGTGCQACGNKDTEGYYDHECYTLAAFSEPRYFIDYILPVDGNDESREKYNCKDEDREKPCTKEYRGVCAHKSDCKSDCELTSATFCTACSNKEIAWVESGVCIEPRTEAEASQYIKNLIATVADGVANDNKAENANGDAGVSVSTFNAYRCKASDRGDMCDTLFDPVCAYKKCSSGYCPVEKSNKCFACIDSNIDYVVESECINVGSKRVYFPCGEEERVAQCSENLANKRNVCGRYNNTNCENSYCFENYDTVCDACAELKIQHFYDGECSSSFIRLSMIVFLFTLIFA